MYTENVVVPPAYGGWGSGLGIEGLLIGMMFGGWGGGWGGYGRGVAGAAVAADAMSNGQIALDLQRGICDVNSNVSNSSAANLSATANQTLSLMQRFCDSEKETATGFAAMENKLDTETYRTLAAIIGQTGEINNKINGVEMSALNTKFELSKQMSDCCCNTEKQIMALDAKLTSRDYEAQLRESNRELARQALYIQDQKDALRDMKYDCREGARYNNLANWDFQTLRTLGQVPNPAFPTGAC